MTTPTTNGVLLIVLAVTLAISAPFLSRHPVLMRWAKRKQEQRILAPDSHPATAPDLSLRRVLGPEPCPLTFTEVTAFEAVAAELKGLEYQWITDAINGAAEADQ